MPPGAIKGKFGQSANLRCKTTIENNCIPEPNSGCWIWINVGDKNGYGRISINRKMYRSNRASYEIYNNVILSSEQYVLHKCDNPSCVNPDHLFIGTNEENMKDMADKGRASRGSKNYNSKLTESNVVEIKKMLSTHVPQKDIARLFNVNSRTISVINTNKAWKHVDIDKGGGLF